MDSGTQLPARGSQGHRRCLQWRTSSSEHGGARPLTTAANVITTAAECSWEAAPEEKASLFSCLSLSLAQRTGCGEISTCLRVTKEPAGREIKGRRHVQSGGTPRQASALWGGLESEGLSQAYQSGEEGLVLPRQGRTGPGRPWAGALSGAAGTTAFGMRRAWSEACLIIFHPCDLGQVTKPF